MGSGCLATLNIHTYTKIGKGDQTGKPQGSQVMSRQQNVPCNLKRLGYIEEKDGHNRPGIRWT